jgi:hypothetical protein
MHGPQDWEGLAHDIASRADLDSTVVHLTAVLWTQPLRKKVAQRGGGACALLLASQIWGEADWRDTYCQAG